MDLKTGYPFWLIKNGLPYHYPQLNQNIKTGVTIIGGGISGALAAYYLTQSGIDTVVLDKRTVGLGSTCASTSLVQYELDKPLCELAELIGERNANEVYVNCVGAISTLSEICKKIGFKEAEACPSLYFSAKQRDASLIEKEFIARRKAGIDVKLLDSKTLYAEYGFRPSNAIESSAGLAVDIYMLCHALFRHSLKKGLSIYDRTTVVKTEENRKNFRVHTENGFYVDCKYIVNAAGYEAGEFMSRKIVKLQSSYAIASEHIDNHRGLWKNRAMLWNTDDPYLYMRLTTDNRIIVGGRDENLYDSSKRDKLIKRKSRLLAHDFQKLFPEINFRAEFSWAGTFGVTKDSLPFIGSVKKHPRVFYALGYGGNGILFSTIAATIISDVINGKKNKIASLFSFERI